MANDHLSNTVYSEFLAKVGILVYRLDLLIRQLAHYRLRNAVIDILVDETSTSYCMRVSHPHRLCLVFNILGRIIRLLNSIKIHWVRSDNLRVLLLVKT